MAGEKRFGATMIRLLLFQLALLALVVPALGSTIEVNPCDRLAASQIDPQRVSAGVRFADIDGAAAVAACRLAVASHPEIQRFKFQLGRALAKTGDHRAGHVMFFKAAVREYGAAQHALGVDFVSGQGVQQNPIKASWWWRKAADHRIVNAWVNLGVLYEQGEGVRQDFGEAYLWYGLALADETISDDLARTVRDRQAAVVAQLTDEQRAEARARVESWQPGIVLEHLTAVRLYNICEDCMLQRVDFRRFDLGKVVFRGSDLSGANFNGIDLRNADFRGADLEGASFRGSNLRNADFRGANLTRADMWSGDYRGARFDGAVMTEVRLFGSRLIEASLVGVEMTDCNCANGNFTGANFEGSNLAGASFTAAVLHDAHLAGVNLSGAWMVNADFSGASLADANLEGATLEGSNFSNADISAANFNGAVLDGASFENANLDDVLGLDRGGAADDEQVSSQPVE